VLNKTVDGIQCTVVVYVDDLLITSRNPEMIEEVRTLMVREFQEMKTKDGNEVTYLGMSLIIKNGEIKIKMDYYIQNVLKDWDNMSSQRMGSCFTRTLIQGSLKARINSIEPWLSFCT